MDVAEVGIIGGADGSTSIFIATSATWPLIIGVSVIITLIAVGLIVRKKKHK